MLLMNNIRFILLVLFSVLILSCDCEHKITGGGGGVNYSITIDNRCAKIRSDEFAKVKEQKAQDCAPKTPGVYPVYASGGEIDLRTASYAPDYYEYYLTPEKCKLFSENFRKRVDKLCAELPPPGPGDVDVLSGNVFFKDGKPFMVDGEPVCN